MLGKHPFNGPSGGGDGGNELPQARRSHRDEEFAEFSVALDADFDLDRRPYDRRAPNEFCFHAAPLKSVAYASPSTPVGKSAVEGSRAAPARTPPAAANRLRGE